MITIGHQAKEFYPDCHEIDFRIAGSYRRLSVLNEAEFLFKTCVKTRKILRKLVEIIS